MSKTFRKSPYDYDDSFFSKKKKMITDRKNRKERVEKKTYIPVFEPREEKHGQ